MKNNLGKKQKTNYYERRPLISIRSDLPKEILAFIKKLKRVNQGSKWINTAIREKYEREKKLK